ncbi:MAG TPA: patatin-like phospholipase family protein [bacterium]|nr:patatin-like phospholipase family protein [bacterium]HPN43760.1 patatin-like phospholipase family protein [bacterium]
MFAKKGLSVALGGGGARGLAHIGALRVLQNEGIPVAQLVGVSMGAIVGGAYAQLGDIDAVEKKFRMLMESGEYKANGMLYTGINKVASGWFEHIACHIREQTVINVANFKESVFPSQRLYKILEMVLRDEKIEHTGIPFAIVATDLYQGRDVIIDSGPMIEAVMASSSLPGYFPPVKVGEKLLIDGAFTFPVPIEPAKARMPGRKVVAIDVSDTMPANPVLEYSIDIVLQSYNITARRYHDLQVKNADVLIEPNVGHYHWSEFDKIDYFIQEGEKATLKKLADIKKLLRR